MTSDVSFTVVNRTDGIITLGVFLRNYRRPTLRMQPCEVFEILRSNSHVVHLAGEEIDAHFKRGDEAAPRTPRIAAAAPPDWPREARRIVPQPRETMPVFEFSTNSVVAVIDVDLRAAIDSGRYFPSVDGPLQPDQPTPPPPPPPFETSYWLAIVRRAFDKDGNYFDREISTQPHEIKPGQTAVITGGEWKGYIWNIG